ncbi:hypothetical protein [Salibacterium aidingense]|uniref:hypothetical protein n=1 Tax=Salibacterium aidingense TaxID=384933 RepID=UPI000405FDF0|nr:hypothetical protein [Salibacterium aidingense]
MIVCSLSAVTAFITGLENVSTASSDQMIVEAWRLFGFIVFAGIFLLLALRPRQYPGIWELVIFHKLAVTVSAFFLFQQTGEALFIAIVDGSLAFLLILAYVAAKGYTAWRQ